MISSGIHTNDHSLYEKGGYCLWTNSLFFSRLVSCILLPAWLEVGEEQGDGWQEGLVTME